MRILLLGICLLIVSILANYPQDPYGELGLKRSANAKDIKKAYKSLAREWHPDKNSSPEAQEKFVSITKAYEILSDPLKRERFDKFGTFDDSPAAGGGFHGGFGGGFNSFFNGFGFGSDDDLFVRQRVSIRQYTHGILDRSHEQPFILYVYSNYCQFCFQLKGVWKSVTEDLEPLGYGIGTVNAMMDGNLAEKLRVTHLPSIVAIVEGRVIHLRNDLRTLNPRGVRLFARDVIPKTFLLPMHSYDMLKRFVDSWSSTNKISVLIMGALPEPRTRYLLTAMKYSHFARFAYVHLGENSVEVVSMRNALDIKCTQCDNVLIFNDSPENGPIARISISSGSQFTMEALSAFIDQNKFLSVSRLSSSKYLDELCPVSSRNPRHLCVILPIVDGSEDVNLLEKYRQYVRKVSKNWTSQHVQLTYIYANKQSDWLRPFLDKSTPSNSKTARDVLIFWRFEHVKAKFRWLSGGWDGDEGKMDQLIGEVVAQRLRLEHTAQVGDIGDEYYPTLWTRWTRAAVRLWESAWFHMTKEEALPIFSVIGSILIILILGYAINYLNSDAANSKKMKKEASMDDWHPEDPKTKDSKAQEKNPEHKIKRVMSIMSPLMHELRAESYFGMIRLLKPGCRSLVVLVDEESKDRLLSQFAQYIFPLRNNKTFSFGFLMIDKNLPWFRKLLEHTLPLGEAAMVGNESFCERLRGINPRQTVGTVLALCGWKLYFSIYHPKHSTGTNRHFLGFDDDEEFPESSDSEDGDGEKGTREEHAMLRRSNSSINTDNVLNSFPNWLDRLLEGSIRRYYIPEWPENLK